MPYSSAPTTSAVSWYLEIADGCAGRLNSAQFPTTTSLVIGVGSNMSKSFYSWMTRGGDGAVVTVDSSGKVLYKDLFRGKISQIQLPACDAASQNTSYVVMTMLVADVKSVTPGGHYSGITVPAKPIMARDFKFSVPGVDGFQYVSSVTGLSIGNTPPAMAIQLVESRAGAIRSWLQNGNSPKGGSLQYLGPSLTTSIFTVEFESLRVGNIVPAFPTNPNQKITVNLKAASAILKC